MLHPIILLVEIENDIRFMEMAAIHYETFVGTIWKLSKI